MGERSRVLPMLDAERDVRSAPAHGVPDPERLVAGWTFRFVAVDERAREMMALYEELGFEVAGDVVADLRPTEACPACFGAGSATHLAVYTR